jgi:hypothetical protein
MFTRIGDLPNKVNEITKSECNDPEHYYPPRYLLLQEGVYKNICPTCGHEHIFHVERPSWTYKTEGYYQPTRKFYLGT